MKRKGKPVQGELQWHRWGGPRKGAGRKPKKRDGKRGRPVPHDKRPPHAARHPVHVSTRLCEGLPSMRKGRTLYELLRVFAAGKEREGFRLLHFAVMGDHVHLLVEADDRRSLSRGAQGLKIRIARALNRLWRRKGRVFLERFHEHVLRTPAEVWNALRYLFHNARKHGLPTVARVDPFTSGAWFDGCAEDVRNDRVRASWLERWLPVSTARTWLLRTGWRRRGPIPLPAG